ATGELMVRKRPSVTEEYRFFLGHQSLLKKSWSGGALQNLLLTRQATVDIFDSRRQYSLSICYPLIRRFALFSRYQLLLVFFVPIPAKRRISGHRIKNLLIS
ncbi:MAG: hypothetical protein K2L18_05140, partial [Acetatifactor sp.]|nr:hypothetical protein [Acetatifactor sp.]